MDGLVSVFQTSPPVNNWYVGCKVYKPEAENWSYPRLLSWSTVVAQSKTNFPSQCVAFLKEQGIHFGKRYVIPYISGPAGSLYEGVFTLISMTSKIIDLHVVPIPKNWEVLLDVQGEWKKEAATEGENLESRKNHKHSLTLGKPTLVGIQLTQKTTQYPLRISVTRDEECTDVVCRSSYYGSSIGLEFFFQGGSYYVCPCLNEPEKETKYRLVIVGRKELTS